MTCIFQHLCTRAKLLLSPDSKIVNVLYKFLYDQYCERNFMNSWLSCIKNILDTCGYSNVWNEQAFINIKWLKITVEQRLKDQYIQKWQSDIHDSSMGKIYSIFKTEFGLEKYLNILPKKTRTIFIKFRTANHRLPVETGRWCGTPKHERICHICKNESNS